MKTQSPVLSFRETPWYRWTTLFILVALCAILLGLLITNVPALMDWRPNDYTSYVYWAEMFKQGRLNYDYPLPVVLWFFVPLTFLPIQFALVVAVAPFIIILWMHGRKGLILFPFYPLLVQTGYAQIDGLLIVPLMWALENRPIWGAVGTLLLVAKPSLAPLTILYMIVRWIQERDFRNLRWFAGLSILFVLPAFIIDPLWPVHFFARTQLRAGEPNMVPRGASIWAWFWHGGITVWLAPLVILLVLGLLVYIARRERNLTSAVQALGLISFPSLYVSASTMLIPLLTTWQEMLLMTVVSWLLILVDAAARGWGGIYVLIPVTMLVLLARRAQLTHKARIGTNAKQSIPT